MVVVAFLLVKDARWQSRDSDPTGLAPESTLLPGMLHWPCQRAEQPRLSSAFAELPWRRCLWDHEMEKAPAGSSSERGQC